MSIRGKLLDFKQRLSDRHMYSVTLVVIALIASFGIYQYKKGLDYRNAVENTYRRSFTELVNYVEELEVTLAKGILVRDPKQLVHLSSEIFRQAEGAKTNLAQLPISTVELDNTSKFLSQVGDYSYNLSLKYLQDKSISDEEIKQLRELTNYAATLSDSLVKMQDQLYQGTMRFGEIKGLGKVFAKNEVSFAQNISEVEKQFQNYPSLIYDGPFSEHINKMQPKFLEGKNEISQEEALNKAKEFLGDAGANLQFQGEGNGTIQTYHFASSSDNGDINIDITKKGGYVLWMLNSRSVAESKLSIEDAKAKAVEFLNNQGFPNMKESYYEIKSNTALINFAYVQDGVVMYPDLIKVKIALDNGDVIGFESKGYLMSHHERKLQEIKISKEQALKSINNILTVENISLAYIPLESKREVMCYEIKAKMDDKTYLVYVNVTTGNEEDILLLLESPDGVLTI